MILKKMGATHITEWLRSAEKAAFANVVKFFYMMCDRILVVPYWS